MELSPPPRRAEARLVGPLLLLLLLGQPFVSEGYRSPEAQDELYTHEWSAPRPIVTYKCGGKPKHNELLSIALDAAF